MVFLGSVSDLLLGIYFFGRRHATLIMKLKVVRAHKQQKQQTASMSICYFFFCFFFEIFARQTDRVHKLQEPFFFPCFDSYREILSEFYLFF